MRTLLRVSSWPRKFEIKLPNCFRALHVEFDVSPGYNSN